MKSAFECFQRAAKCEAMASTVRDDLDRTTLKNAADYWKGRGERAKRVEAAERSEPPATKPAS